MNRAGLLITIVWVLSFRASAVFLTFDDGPDARYTPEILDILSKHHVPATFFVVGKNAKFNKTLVSQIAMEGHSIGNHSYTHAFLSRLSNAGISNEILKTNQIIEEITGKAPTCFRPPYGDFGKRVRTVVKSHSLKPVLWNVDSRDFTGLSSSAMAQNVIKAAGPNDIILMHDLGRGGNRTKGALESIIEGLKAKGFEFKKICD